MMRVIVKLTPIKLPIPNSCSGLPSTAATFRKAQIQKERKRPRFASINLSYSHTYLGINKGKKTMETFKMNIFFVKISMIEVL